MRVELLWWEGCPSHPQALAELREALRAEGIDEDVLEVRHIASDEEAERTRFPGIANHQDRRRGPVPARSGRAAGAHLPRLPAAATDAISPVPDPDEVRATLRRVKESR